MLVGEQIHQVVVCEDNSSDPVKDHVRACLKSPAVLSAVMISGYPSFYVCIMMVTLVFPSYLMMSDFLVIAGKNDIDMDLKKKTMTSDFSDEQVQEAVTRYHAHLLNNIQKKGN